jgi:signal transduction histidine kinase
MRERLKLVAGELSIDSQAQKGTEVRATIPLIGKAAAVGKT